ncbi:hypothetical protein MBLNU459_g2677t3 [Dothideomycetes sp. NU459]
MRAWRTVTGIVPCRSINAKRYSSAIIQKPKNIAILLQHSAKSDSTAPAEIEVEGFVRTIRKQKRIAFAAISDGSSMQPVQAVLKPEQAESLTTGAAVRLRGEWQKCPPGKQQSHELQVSSAQLLGENDATTYPIQKKYQTPEFLRALPHLRARLPLNALVLQLRSRVIASVTSYFAREGFVQTHTPIVTSSDCEGAGEVFTVSSSAAKGLKQHSDNGQTEHFFRTPKYLTVSAQLHLEALAQSVGKVWTLSPTFRAEKSDTPRHLSEFYMLEAEVCFTDDMNHVMDVVEGMLSTVAGELKDSQVVRELMEARSSASAEETDIDQTVSAETLKKRWDGLCKPSWPRIKYERAIAALDDAVSNGTPFQFKPSWEDGLQAEHEKYLATHFGQGQPVFITNYPRHQKPFYMAPSQDNVTVDCFDLLVPDLCELVGGSMREHRSRELLGSMKEHGLLKDAQSDRVGSEAESNAGNAGDGQSAGGSPSNMQWYADLRRYGSVPHGGFGLGFDRLLSYLSGVPNIRDVVAFPRWYGRCDC